MVLVEGSVVLWNNTEGLCGTLNGNPEDDFMTRDKTIAKTKSVLASSWQVNKIGGNMLFRRKIILFLFYFIITLDKGFHFLPYYVLYKFC